MLRRISQPLLRCPTRELSSPAVSEDVSKFLAERTVLRHNGAKARRLFSDGEYERRLANLR